MKTLQLTEAEARKLYPTAPNELKVIFKSTFGENAFSTSPIDRIKSFEDACAELGEDPNAARFTKGSISGNAFEKMLVINKALIGNWVPDFSNTNQYKWVPYYTHNGSRLVFSHVNLWLTRASVSSRLCFPDAKTAEYFGRQFIDLMNEFFTY